MGFWPFNQRRPRLRRFSKWLGLVAVVLIVLLHVASGWCCLAIFIGDVNLSGNYHQRGGIIQLYGGQIYSAWTEDTIVDRYFVYWGGGGGPPEFRWWFDFRHYRDGLGIWGTNVYVPLWAPALVLAMPTVWLWWRDRPSRRRTLGGQCSKCGYDLSGLAAGQPCPECGRVVVQCESGSPERELGGCW